MLAREYWSTSRIAVLGAGHWGTVLAQLAAPHCREVRLWARKEEQARTMGATRANPEHFPGMVLSERIHALADLDRVFEGGVQAVLWALPSQGCREQARQVSPYFGGDEILLHATKGIEQRSLKRISQVLREEIPCPRIGVISGPNLADEIARGEPAATVIASAFEEAIVAGRALLDGDLMHTEGSTDVIGVEWAGVLKNILAIAAGALDALKAGWNVRGMLITRGLEEMVRFGQSMGAKPATFLTLAGVGDLLATCGSPLSRNYRVGYRLAQGLPLQEILDELGSTAEGVLTAQTIAEFALQKQLAMPVTQAVCAFLKGELDAPAFVKAWSRSSNPLSSFSDRASDRAI